MPEGQEHECDLFLMSSHHPYGAESALSEFASRGSLNIHGWGIGSYLGRAAVVVRSESSVVSDSKSRDLSNEFRVAILATHSPIVLGHLRLSSRGSLGVQNNHPFCLSFLGYDWLFVHNGTAVDHEKLVPVEERLLVESDNDSARVFEFLRRQVIDYYLSSYRKSLIQAWRHAFKSLLSTNNGSFNIIVSNGYLSFALVHWRSFWYLHREKQAGDALLVTTLKLTDNEEWVVFNKRADRTAKLLVFSGHSLILNGDVA